MSQSLVPIYERALQGNRVAKRELIELCLPFVHQAVGSFVRVNYDFRNQYDDLFDAGHFELVIAIDRLLAIRPRNFIPAIKRAIRCGIAREAATDGTSACANTLRAMRAKAQRIQGRLDELEALPFTVERHREHRNLSASLARTKTFARRQLCPTDNEISCSSAAGVTELSDVIDASCMSDRDREIVELRSQYFTDAEIGELLSIDESTVQRCRREVEKRFNIKMKEADCLALGA